MKTQSITSTSARPVTEERNSSTASTPNRIKMKHSVFTQKWIYTALLGVLYAYLFHNFTSGLNTLIFDVLLLGFFLKTEQDISSRPLFTIAAGGLLLSGISVVMVHSNVSSLAHSISLLLVFGVARVREIRFIWFGLLLGIISIFRVPLDYLAYWKQAFASNSEKGSFRWRYAIIPVLIVLPFVCIYYAANPGFASALNRVFSVGNFVQPTSILLFCCGSWLGAAMLFPYSQRSYLAQYDQGLRDDIPRRGKPGFPFFSSRASNLGLTHEFRMARFTFIGLNALLLLVNLSDLLGLVFFRRAATAAEYSQSVHSGTYLLMLSIVLAILVVVVFFRGLLNYYPKVAELRRLAFFWIVQNALLALFVLARNVLYVQHAGLAWGRVLVFFWLILIGFGLFSLYRKVDRRLSFSYLLHANGMAAWLGLLLLGAINWDGVITRYNLATQAPTQIDYPYLISDLEKGNSFLLAQDPNLRQRVYPALLQSQNWRDRNAIYTLQSKTNPAHHPKRDWRSWNYPDYRNRKVVLQHQAY